MEVHFHYSSITLSRRARGECQSHSTRLIQNLTSLNSVRERCRDPRLPFKTQTSPLKAPVTAAPERITGFLTASEIPLEEISEQEGRNLVLCSD